MTAYFDPSTRLPEALITSFPADENLPEPPITPEYRYRIPWESIINPAILRVSSLFASYGTGYLSALAADNGNNFQITLASSSFLISCGCNHLLSRNNSTRFSHREFRAAYLKHCLMYLSGAASRIALKTSHKPNKTKIAFAAMIVLTTYCGCRCLKASKTYIEKLEQKLRWKKDALECKQSIIDQQAQTIEQLRQLLRNRR
ncbi:MAG: hypothetical protein ACQEP8_02120 [Chlamydiota bacterium]